MAYNAYDLSITSPLPNEQINLNCAVYQIAIANLIIDFLETSSLMVDDWNRDLSLAHDNMKPLVRNELIAPHLERAVNKLLAEQLVLSPSFERIYHSLVSHIVRSTIKEECLYMRHPTLRCVFPNQHSSFFAPLWRNKNSEFVSFHSDILFGDPTGQVQGWLPLTDLEYQSTISLMPLKESIGVLEGFFANNGVVDELPLSARESFFRYISENPTLLENIKSLSSKVQCRQGDVLLFDVRCLHATTDPLEALRTRVSLDFRIVPSRIYRKRMNNDGSPPNFMGIELTMGNYYAEDFINP